MPFKKGQSGNPAGRPKGSRNKLSEAFLKALSADFDEHGLDALVRMREERPGDYIKVVASILPAKAELEVTGSFVDVLIAASERAGSLDTDDSEVAEEPGTVRH